METMKNYSKSILGYFLNKLLSIAFATTRLLGLSSLWRSKEIEGKPEIKAKKLVFIDTETTGLYFNGGDRLVEIACCLYENRNHLSTFHTLLNPERLIPVKTTQIHGITNEMVQEAPKFGDIAEEFLNFVQDSVLVGHNSKRFDIPFINSELVRANLAPLSNEQEDTLEIHRQLYPGQPAKLDDLCNRFQVDLTERNENGHGAYLDAQLTAQCYFKMIKNID